jgi:hypothetical protein
MKNHAGSGWNEFPARQPQPLVLLAYLLVLSLFFFVGKKAKSI